MRWLFNTDSLIRRDRVGTPIEISYTTVPSEVPAPDRWLLKTASAGISPVPNPRTPATIRCMSSGKSDMLIVNRSTKSDNLGRAAPEYDQLGSASDVLDGGAQPMRFE